MSLIEVGTSETGTTVLLIPVKEQTYLVVLEDGCLLYTSPSPRDRSLSRMPSSA